MYQQLCVYDILCIGNKAWQLLLGLKECLSSAVRLSHFCLQSPCLLAHNHRAGISRNKLPSIEYSTNWAVQIGSHIMTDI